MSETDYRTIQALARCSFQPGSWPKRFVRDLASYPRDKELTEKQQAALARVAWHYRKQLARHGVAVETRPPGVGPDPEAANQRELEQLKAWNEGKPL
jgi:hypothetical protein